MNKTYFNWRVIEGACLDIARQLNNDNWKPEYIVGLTRGGLIPATMLSHYMNVPCKTLHVQLRDGHEGEDDTETNCWMADDAAQGKKILIVDDINDTGATLNWIQKDWATTRTSGSWGDNVRVAVIVNNVTSTAAVDYSVYDIDKDEKNEWFVFPWEEFWK